MRWFAGPAVDTAVVEQLRPRVRACYNSGLNAEPLMEGTLTISLVLDAYGNVASAATSKNQGLSQATVQCIPRKLTSAELHPAGPPGARISARLTLTQDK